MNEAKPSNEQVCRDLRPLFEGMRAPVTLKKVRKRIQAPKRSASVQKLINIFGLEELCNLTLRLLQEGSFLPEVYTLFETLLIGMNADFNADRFGKTNGMRY